VQAAVVLPLEIKAHGLPVEVDGALGRIDREDGDGEQAAMLQGVDETSQGGPFAGGVSRRRRGIPVG